MLSEDESNWSPYENYVFAKSTLNRATAASYAVDVLPYLERAVEADADLIVAYPPLISILNSRCRSTQPGLHVSQDMDRAQDLCKRGQVLDGNYANLHIAEAWCLIRRREFAFAEQSLEKAIRLSPYEATRLNSIGSLYVLLGDLERGEEFYLKAREMQHNGLDFQNTDLGELCYLRRDYDAAISYLSIGEARNPNYSRILRAAALAQVGRLAEASTEASSVLEDLEQNWKGREKFTVARASQWFAEDFPLRRQMDYDNLIEGMSKAGFKF